MKESKVMIYNDNVASVTKTFKLGREVTVYIIKYKTIVCIVRKHVNDMDGECVMLVKVKFTESEAYNKWLYLIGKMCKKDILSKYFSNCGKFLHFNNGDQLDDDTQQELLTYIKQCLVEL